MVMRKIDFILKNKSLKNEMLDNDLAISDNMMPDGNESEIETGPVANSSEFSDYKKGVSPTTDKVRMDVSQGPDWQRAYTGLASYIYKSSNMSTDGWNSHVFESDESVVEKLIDTRISDRDIVNKISDNELKNDKEFISLIKKINSLSDKKKAELKNIIY